MFFFGLAYFAQGLAGGLIAQPLAYYLKSLGFAADHMAQLVAITASPWLMKPLYGLMSDFIPLFGFRRKSYLLVMTGFASAGYLWLVSLETPTAIIGVLFLITLGTAISDVMVDALMVEHGQKTGLIRQFQGQQWTWLNVASITAGLLGGWLSHSFSPLPAVHLAALIIAAVPVAVMATTLFVITEPKIRLERKQIQTTGRDLLAVIKSRSIWIVAGFLAFWNLTPNFGVPLYYHMTDHLEFDQYFIGQLHSIGSVGAAIGAFLYGRYLVRILSTKRLVFLSVGLSVTTTCAYLLLADARSALMLSFASGIVSMIPLLTLFGLAASVCPPRVAAFTFAALMAFYSAAGQVAALLGSHLYAHIFDYRITPLICLAAGFTLTAVFWVPYLPVGSSSADPELIRREQAGGNGASMLMKLRQRWRLADS
jgi:MFS family permease